MSGRRFPKRNPPPSNTAATTIARFEASAFSGPLPPPEILARYNEVVQNGAERIFAMVERQGIHREELEKCVVQGNVRSQARGAWLGFIVSMFAMGAGAYLIAIGKGGYGFATILANLVALVSAFVFVRQRQKTELAEKATALEKRRTN